MAQSRETHRHIIEVGLAFLAHSSVLVRFEADAFSLACYLIDRLPSKVISNSTPLERLFGIKSDYSLLKFVCCACWPNLRSYNQHKFQFRSMQCVFIGYSIVHKGYKYLHALSGRVYISRDVVFDETIFPFSKSPPTTSHVPISSSSAFFLSFSGPTRRLNCGLCL